MTVKNNPVLGTVACDCGQDATVHQTSRGKGRFFYTRCTKCGVDQRTGPAVQKRLWEKTVWRDGVEKVKPPGVGDSDWSPPAPAAPAAEKKPDQAPKDRPKKSAPVPAENPAVGSVFLGLGLVAAALATGWAMLKGKGAAPAAKSKPVTVQYDERFR